MMDNSSMPNNEKIIKNKNRVQNHGEVFTPKRIVNKMLDLPTIRDACKNLTYTFLEPAVGEGVFLMEILNRKLNMVSNKYGDDLIHYENYSLLALSTLYGVELLEDNAQKCVMNMYQIYYEEYQKQANNHGTKIKDKVLKSAKLIISKNIIQGNFLTKLSADGNYLIFNEWQAINFNKKPKILKIQRTEYTLKDIIEGVEKENGEKLNHGEQLKQLDFFNLYGDEEITETKERHMKYIPVKIIEVYKEEMEDING